MPYQSVIISKQRRRELFRLWLPDLLPPCRQCFPFLRECTCKHECRCEIDIEIMDYRDEETCPHEWPTEEAVAYLGMLGDVLARLDPYNYAAPPSPTSPIVTISADLRIAAMSARNSSGFSLYHPQDRSSDSGREGELIQMQGNGVKKRRGVGKVDESRHEARWAHSYDKKSHRIGV